MNGLGVIERAGELARAGQACALATVVWRQGPSSSKQGSRAIITADGQLHGWIGGACAEPAVIREARQVMADGTARLLLLGSPGQFGAPVPEGMTVIPISCQSEGALQVYIEPVLPVPHLVVVGGSPMAHALAAMARALGWRADRYRPQDLTADGAGNDAGRGAGTQGGGRQWADERSMVVVATQGQADEDVIERAAAVRPAYLGLVASRRRAEAVLGYLAERGVPAERLDRVHAPAGLDLGRTSHEEMAVAVLAELVRLRASGALAAAPAPRGGQRGDLEPAEAVDPVCGMTVTADAASLPVTRDGTTYYFCCGGCRQRFSANPDTYVKAVLR